MKNQKIIFILIGLFCIFALIAGIYTQFFIGNSNNNIQESNISNANEVKTKSQEEIKEQFSELFTNELINNGYDVLNIEKNDSTKDIVYSAYDISKQEENYEINIHLPVINIKGSVPVNFNKITQSIFADKASEIMSNKYTEKVIYSVDYIAYINENILSLIIESTLKQGNNPQRVVVQTYNYNLQTQEEVKAVEILSKKGIIQSDCKNKINEVITKAQEEAQILVNSGYTVYNRDLSNDMYKLENISTFFLDDNENLYIVFAYGNQNFTSEMDIILFEN